MNEKSHRFEAVIIGGESGGAGVVVPLAVEEIFGTRGRVPVIVTYDGHAYRGSMVPMGGRHLVAMTKAVRAAIGKDVGDTVQVVLRRDTAERVVDVPPELRNALDANAAARERFDRMSYTHRKEYARWVAEAKKQATRDNRAAKAIGMILAGKTR